MQKSISFGWQIKYIDKISLIKFWILNVSFVQNDISWYENFMGLKWHGRSLEGLFIAISLGNIACYN